MDDTEHGLCVGGVGQIEFAIGSGHFRLIDTTEKVLKAFFVNHFRFKFVPISTW